MFFDNIIKNNFLIRENLRIKFMEMRGNKEYSIAGGGSGPARVERRVPPGQGGGGDYQVGARRRQYPCCLLAVLVVYPNYMMVMDIRIGINLYFR